MKHTIRHVALCITLAALSAGASAQETNDPNFDASVKQKTYSTKEPKESKDKKNKKVQTVENEQNEHPRVAIDGAHNNYDTMDARYKPLADLLANDGYEVLENKEKFQPQTLRSLRVLIVANARGEGATDDSSPPAFTDAECDIVRDWVSDGGNLLLLADHTPFANASSILSRTFGVSMGKGITFDLANFEGTQTNVAFRLEKQGLGDHPILRGRNPAERIKKVVTFRGQSLSVPGIGTPLLKFGPTSHESENQNELQMALEGARNAASGKQTALRHATPAIGRAQALALTFGKGRVVVVGDADLFTAQLGSATQPSSPDSRIGMNTPGADNKQFVLNVVHWLSSAL